MLNIPYPAENEYPAYASIYVSRVPQDGLVLQHLESNLQKIKDLVNSLPPEKLTTPCAPDEWTVQEILVHIMDTERIVAYRGLRIARGDMTPLAGFEQDDYVPPSKANERTLDNIWKEYDAIRAATLTLFKNLHEEVLTNVGTASNKPLSVRAAAYFIAGHELHHLESIQENYA